MIKQERDAIHDQLRRNHIEILTGTAAFADPHTLEIAGGVMTHHVTSERFVIAVGTTPARPDGVDFDDGTVLDSDGILGLRSISPHAHRRRRRRDRP